MGFVEKVERQEWEDSLTDEWQEIPKLTGALRRKGSKLLK